MASATKRDNFLQQLVTFTRSVTRTELDAFPDSLGFWVDISWSRRTARQAYEYTQLQTYSQTLLGLKFDRSFGAPHCT